MTLKRILFPILLGLSGIAVLVWLGLWQVQRLDWKQAILADIDTRLATAPVPLDLSVTKDADAYRVVSFAGTPTGEELHVLTSGTAAGTGFRVITGFETDAGRILLDQGLLALDAKDAPALIAPMEVTGTLLWPDDQNDNTPEPDLAKNIWFARNVTTMAAALDTAPIMVVARTVSPPDPRLTPLPVDTGTIKNDHFEYAVTWFLLAVVWGAMSLFLIKRTLRPKDA